MSQEQTKTLFHYTAECWWTRIARTGAILSTWGQQAHGIPASGLTPLSHLYDHLPHCWHFNRLIWLTPVLDPVQSWQAGGMERKCEIRVTVETSKAVHWPEYAERHDLPLNRVHKRDRPEDWWVARDGLWSSEWKLARRTADNEILWTPQGGVIEHVPPGALAVRETLAAHPAKGSPFDVRQPNAKARRKHLVLLPLAG
jgi:hypothetical protein